MDEQKPVTITLDERDVMRLEVINMDADEKEALAFLRERLLPEVRRRKGQQVQCHLHGGKGSPL